MSTSEASPLATSTEQLQADAAAQQELREQKAALTLDEVRQLAEKLRSLENEIMAEQAATQVKIEEARRLSEVTLPEALNGVGLSEVKLLDGSTIGVVESINGSITDENRPAAHAWLRENGYGDIIKNVVSVAFGKGEDDDALKLLDMVKQKADSGELHFGELNQKETVHNSTLNAFIKEQLKKGNPLPMETFKVFIRQVARLKAPKKAKA